MEPTELVEVKLSFLATRGEEEPSALAGIVTSGGVIVEEMEVTLLGEEREIETTPSISVTFLEVCCLALLELWLSSGLAFWLLLM